MSRRRWGLGNLVNRNKKGMSKRNKFHRICTSVCHKSENLNRRKSIVFAKILSSYNNVHSCQEKKNNYSFFIIRKIGE